MKEKLKKITITIITVLIAFNCIICNNQFNIVLADGLQTLEDETRAMADNKESKLDGFADALLGIVTLIPKMEAWAIVSLVKVLIGSISQIAGGDSGMDFSNMSLEAILFNKINLIKLDFFNYGNSPLQGLRKSVATWYYSLRNLSIIILLGVLLYVGIRMAISTVAEEEAKYKKMFKDWVVSLILLFVLHYIIIFVIDLNSALVDVMKPSSTSGAISSFEGIQNKIWDVKFTVGVGSLFVYAITVGMMFIYLFMYIKRMLTVAFLIIISPLITITYSIDKMGDGKSQALNTWFKEFVFNVLIQPFHCIIYLVFIDTAFRLVQNATFASSILAVIMMIFTFTAEKLVKKIFNFQSESLGAAIGNTAALTAGMSFLSKRGEKSAKDNPKLDKIPNMQGPGMFPGSAGQQQSGKGNTAIQGTNNSAAANAAAQVASTPSSNAQSGSTGSSAPTKTKSKFLSGAANKKAALRLGKKAGRGIKRFATGRSMKLAQVAAFAMIGAATGTPQGILAGAYAGHSINNAITSKLNKRTANRMVKNNEEYFAGAYKNFQAQTGKSDEEMQTFTQQLMDGTIDKDSLTDEERVYSSYVNKMAGTYKAVGEENIPEHMQETLQKIALPEGDADRITPNFGNAGQYQQGAQQTVEQAQQAAETAQQTSEQAQQAAEAAQQAGEQAQQAAQQAGEQARQAEDLWKNIPNTREEAYEYANNLWAEGKLTDSEHEKMIGEASQRPNDLQDGYDYAANLLEQGKISDDEYTNMLNEYREKFGPQ